MATRWTPIGAMNRLITIRKLENVTNVGGAEKGTEADHATVSASIEPIAGREYFNSQMVQSEVTHRIRLRYVAGVKPKMWIVYGERKFDILSVINLEERNRELELMCKERNA